MRLIVILIIALSSCKKDEAFDVYLDIKNHKFEPEIVRVPKMKKIKIHLTNHDETAEEFESTDLKREKIIPAKSTVIITLAPLKPGEFSFFGEFHEDTAKGKIIVEDHE
jgi:hypothetical protein